jgi:arsenite methyltransferase
MYGSGIMTKKVSEMTSDEIKSEVRAAYSRVAARTECCAPEREASSRCCGDTSEVTEKNLARALGYEVDGMPSSLTESFAGCGNPVALASLKEGEVVLDLGSGAGLDMFVASEKVGPSGRVVGVDMTPDMIEKAKGNAKKLNITNIEFRLGDIEDLPVEDESVDVVISNCVINLAPDKAKVFREAYRVLRPGGRMMVSDIVLSKPLSQELRDEVINYTGCVGGAIPDEEYLQTMRDAGFEDVEVVGKSEIGPWGTYSAYISGSKKHTL